MIRKLFAKLMGSKAKPKKKSVAAKKQARKTKTAPKKPKSRPKKKPAAAKKKKPAVKKPAPAGDEIGEVVAFFRIPVVAVIKVTKGSLQAGDTVWIKGHTTDLKLAISSMQVDHRPVQQAKKGDEVGVKVSARTRRGDRVYRIS